MPGHEDIRKFAVSYEDAWNSGDPERVAACYAPEGSIVINRGTPWQGRAKIAEMAAGFYADVNRMRVILDDLRIAGDHVAFIWTFTGDHSGTGNALNVRGWEEWDLSGDCLIQSSLGWFDAEDYAAQVAGR
ncbi:nuclear transport factor 2 family protein [Albidovulum sediminicola]|uniref:Nuclear transport factor 2 family protein n=1 Tax=Albidovulum sediminicola TaxID=2984331 RepID=A0ABT2Z780_9RHOB|nr:nuclear transport factor 2 family protein [Defluviimonas sp. WL0075]MCV2866890.1 nuclear transport factor 2 family protein [Defluviimonas sp. WL0075]